MEDLEAMKMWYAQLPLRGCAASVKVAGDVNYTALVRVAEMILALAEDVRTTEPRRFIQVDEGAARVVRTGGGEVRHDLVGSGHSMEEVTGVSTRISDDIPSVGLTKDATITTHRVCPACSKAVTVTADGSLRVHGPKASRCPGEAQAPEPAAASVAPPVLTIAPVSEHSPEWPDEEPNEEPAPPVPMTGATSLDEQAKALFATR